MNSENEKLRALLATALKAHRNPNRTNFPYEEIHDALSQQAEPTDAFTAADMATAAAQGFRDGQAAVEPATAQDELPTPDITTKRGYPAYSVELVSRLFATRPAQTEQRPDVKPGDPHAQIVTAGGKRSDQDYVVVRRSLLEAIEACEWRGEMAASSGNELRAVMAGRIAYDLYAAPIAQTAQLVVPDECPHIIVFDDAERENEMFAGCGARPAAIRRFEQISQSWNAHLFVRIEKNSRDAPYPCATTAPQPEQSGLPDVCDGKEQEAFEEFARGERMDTTTHPLHWLFLNEKTNAARQGWKAAIRYCRAALSAQGESHE